MPCTACLGPLLSVQPDPSLWIAGHLECAKTQLKTPQPVIEASSGLRYCSFRQANSAHQCPGRRPGAGEFILTSLRRVSHSHRPLSTPGCSSRPTLPRRVRSPLRMSVAIVGHRLQVVVGECPPPRRQCHRHKPTGEWSRGGTRGQSPSSASSRQRVPDRRHAMPGRGKCHRPLIESQAMAALDREVEAVAAHQAGAFARRQAVAAGATTQAIHRRVGSGAWC